MLVLRGIAGKSLVVNDLLEHTNSICFEYHFPPIIKNSIFLEDNRHTLEDLKECIMEYFKTYTDEHYTYLIVYTNLKEEDAKDFYEWMKYNEHLFNCVNSIVACCEE